MNCNGLGQIVVLATYPDVLLSNIEFYKTMAENKGTRSSKRNVREITLRTNTVVCSTLVFQRFDILLVRTAAAFTLKRRPALSVEQIVSERGCPRVVLLSSAHKFVARWDDSHALCLPAL